MPTRSVRAEKSRHIVTGWRALARRLQGGKSPESIALGKELERRANATRDNHLEAIYWDMWREKKLIEAEQRGDRAEVERLRKQIDGMTVMTGAA